MVTNYHFKVLNYSGLTFHLENWIRERMNGYAEAFTYAGRCT